MYQVLCFCKKFILLLLPDLLISPTGIIVSFEHNIPCNLCRLLLFLVFFTLLLRG